MSVLVCGGCNSDEGHEGIERRGEGRGVCNEGKV